MTLPPINTLRSLQVRGLRLGGVKSLFAKLGRFLILFSLSYWSGMVFTTMSASSVVAYEYKRLDPHGPRELNLKGVNIQDRKECSVCHSKGAPLWDTKPGLIENCQNCHNKFPHSGAPEHLGKSYKNPATGRVEKLTCLSCHSPHRASAKNWEKPGGFFQKPEPPGLESKGLKLTSNEFAMLARSCSECHKW